MGLDSAVPRRVVDADSRSDAGRGERRLGLGLSSSFPGHQSPRAGVARVGSAPVGKVLGRDSRKATDAGALSEERAARVRPPRLRAARERRHSSAGDLFGWGFTLDFSAPADEMVHGPIATRPRCRFQPPHSSHCGSRAEIAHRCLATDLRSCSNGSVDMRGSHNLVGTDRKNGRWGALPRRRRPPQRIQHRREIAMPWGRKERGPLEGRLAASAGGSRERRPSGCRCKSDRTTVSDPRVSRSRAPRTAATTTRAAP
jgi:hypothetical protein